MSKEGPGLKGCVMSLELTPPMVMSGHASYGQQHGQNP